MNKHLEAVLEYFEEDDGTYYIKDGYICIMHGFVNDYISMITPRGTKDVLTGYSMSSDNSYAMTDDNVASLHVYRLENEV